MSDYYDALFRGEIIKRKFVPDNVTLYQRWLDRNEGKRVEFTITRERKKRSNPQLEYYWGVLIAACMAEHGLNPTPANKELYHHTFLEKVARPMLEWRLSVNVRENVALTLAPSTGLFDMAEMTRYIGNCQDYAAREWNVHVPDIDHVRLRKRR